MSARFDEISIADLVENPPEGPEWESWLATHSEVANEIAIARRVRAFMAELHASQVPVPADFEARLMERVRADTTLLDLLDLGVVGLGRTLIEFLNVLLSFLPTTQPESI